MDKVLDEQDISWTWHLMAVKHGLAQENYARLWPTVQERKDTPILTKSKIANNKHQNQAVHSLFYRTVVALQAAIACTRCRHQLFLFLLSFHLVLPHNSIPIYLLLSGACSLNNNQCFLFVSLRLFFPFFLFVHFGVGLLFFRHLCRFVSRFYVFVCVIRCFPCGFCLRVL